MLSLILYGRNDNHGYNLHKRAALSLNCMAEVLSCPDDEILFVDYNTPNDFPTFPEAIADTLTDKAKRHLRVLRVRPAVHGRFAGRTHLAALEPVARNVAVRRSNPANRWILSTNTDMIFVPRVTHSLSEIVGGLADGHYGIPRFEVPETLWESLDRREPRAAIDSIGRWGWDLHLNEIVIGMKPFLFDGPGDFQLMLRDDLFAVNGFDEEMLLGWHVDANIAKRLSFLRGDVGDLSDRIFGYHCDHTRQVTSAHKSNASQNDIHRYFYNVDSAKLPNQAQCWGCPDDAVEEVSLSAGKLYTQSLLSVSAPTLAEPGYVAFVPETYNLCGYTPLHVLPFLLDIFSSAPRNWRVAWLGPPGPMLSTFARAWRDIAFVNPIQVHHRFCPKFASSDSTLCNFHSLAHMAEHADAFIFDFSRGDGGLFRPSSDSDQKIVQFLVDAFDTLISAESEPRKNPRRFIGINTLHTQFEGLFSSNINCAKTPFGIRIRHGFAVRREVKPVQPTFYRPRKTHTPPITVTGPQIRNGAVDLQHLLQAGPAGRMRGGRVLGRAGVAGLVAQSRPLSVPQGRYVVALELRSESAGWGAAGVNFRLVALLVHLRRLLGYPLERKLRRMASRLLGKRLSDWIKASIKKRIGISPDSMATSTSIVRIEAHLGEQSLGGARALGNDIHHWVEDFEIEVPEKPGHEAAPGVAISLFTNGGAKFSVVHAALRVRKPTRSKQIGAAA